jgi:hypothetical protein
MRNLRRIPSPKLPEAVAAFDARFPALLQWRKHQPTRNI